MSITNFNYTIFAVDEAARCMEIIYTAEGQQTMHIGARLPFEGESLEDVVMSFAPISFWKEQAASVVVPTVGITGTISVSPAAKVVLATVENGGIPQAIL